MMCAMCWTLFLALTCALGDVDLIFGAARKEMEVRVTERSCGLFAQCFLQHI